MTVTIALAGKSGSGKTTLTKAFLNALHETYPDKSVLLVDNDMSCELAYSYGVSEINSIYDVKANRFDYKSRLPENMSRQEFIEWAIQDIIVNLYDEVDLLVSGLVSSVDCRCYIAEKINDGLIKLFESYDIVIIDCEYDLEYLNHLVDWHIDATIIVTNLSSESIFLSTKIMESSQNFASPGQLGVVINNINNAQVSEDISAVISEYDIEILGTLPFDEELRKSGIKKESKLLTETVKELQFRLNLPPL